MQDHPLVAVEREAVARAAGAQAHLGQVIARAGLDVREGHAALALRDHGQEALLLSGRAPPRHELAADPHRRQIGLDDEPLPDRLHDDHHVHRRAAEAVVLGGKRQTHEAHLGQLAPGLLAPSLGRRHDLAARVERVVIGDEALEAVREKLLLLREIEVHRVVRPQSPSVILAMMFRWISLEPA